MGLQCILYRYSLYVGNNTYIYDIILVRGNQTAGSTYRLAHTYIHIYRVYTYKIIMKIGKKKS